MADTRLDEYEETLLDPLPIDGMLIPRIRLTLGEPTPYHQVKVGDQVYEYAKSYPIKGHGATLPPYVREQLAAGRTPLLIERPTRYLVYLSI